jgi:hypothetical protein
MADVATQDMPTSTAATRQTEPAVIAAISSAGDRTIADTPGRPGLTVRSLLLLLAAAAALGALTGWWAWRDHLGPHRSRLRRADRPVCGHEAT